MAIGNKDDLVAAKEHDLNEVEHASTSSGEDASDKKTAATIRHRVDWRLIPALGAMYGIALMDRKNVSNATIAGMLVDLKLTSSPGYNLVNMCFFITYILLQPLMIFICRKVGPRFFLPAVCLAWGAVIIGFGFSQTWPTLIPLRLLLGALEAGYFPGCLSLLSCWYTRFEVARRYSDFYLIGSIASALAGIIAYGLQQMDGVNGIRGWRWIFIMEGVLTCAVAIFAYSFLVKFPDEEKVKPSWGFSPLSKPTSSSIDSMQSAEMLSPRNLRGNASYSQLQSGISMASHSFSFAYAFAFTLPIILRTNLGFSIAMSQCLGAPPYEFSGIFMYLAAWYSDRQKTRGPVLCFLCLVSLIGLPIMAFVKNPWGQYFGVFVTIAGTNSAIPAVMAYQSNNIRGQWRRAFCSASLTGIGGIGGIAGALIFRTEDGPTYIPGFATCMACNVLVMATVVILTLYFRKKNKQADRGEIILLEDPNFRFTI